MDHGLISPLKVSFRCFSVGKEYCLNHAELENVIIVIIVYFFPISSVEPARPSQDASFFSIKAPSVVSISRLAFSHPYGEVSDE